MKLTLQQLKVFATIARYGNLGAVYPRDETPGRAFYKH